MERLNFRKLIVNSFDLGDSHILRKTHKMIQGVILLIILVISVTIGQQLPICPTGMSLLMTNNNYTICNAQDPTSCSSIRPGYFCQFSSSGSVFVCCGAQANQCGSSAPQLTPQGVPLNCTFSTNCAQGFNCTSGVCCSTQVNGSVTIGGQCSSTLDCTGGATCMNNQCSCPPGTTNSFGTCQSQGLEAGCQPNQVSVNGQCYNTVQQGGQCFFTQQCVNNGVCTNGFCQTNENNGNCGANQVSVNGQCYNTVQQGGQCSFTQQCVNNGVCTNGFCQTSGNNGNCGANQVAANNTCYDQVPIGATCTVTVQCLGYSVCVSGLCQCPTSFTQNNGVCQSQSQISQCSANQVLIQSTCYPTVSIGGQCQYSQQCLYNSQCMNNNCQCPQGTSNVGGTCSGTGLLSNGVSCSRPGYQAQLQNGQPINCMVEMCDANSICEWNPNANSYICCTGGGTLF